MPTAIPAAKSAASVARTVAAAAYEAGRGTYAAYAAAHAAAYAHQPDIHSVYDGGASTAIDSAKKNGVPRTEDDVSQICYQYQHKNWTDSTPVPPSVFGPLWPEGPPKDWPELPKPTLLKLTVQVPDGMDDAAVCEKLKTLTAALGRLNVAGGGHGLKFVPPVEFTEDQVRGLADVVREEGQKTPGGRHPRR